MPGKKLLLRSMLFWRKFWSDAVFCVLWMSTTYRIGIFIPYAFVAHQPFLRFHCNVPEVPLPAPYLNGPVPTISDTVSVLPVVISVALYPDQMCLGTIGIVYMFVSQSR